MRDGVDVEHLIELVSINPCIWDKKAEGYHSKTVTDEAWSRVCGELNQHFYELPDEHKFCYEKEIIKKWRNIRDQWLKATKKVESLKNRSGKQSYRVRPYVYNDQLAFLNKTITLTYDGDPVKATPSDTSKSDISTPGPSRKKFRAHTIAVEEDKEEEAREEEDVRKKVKLDLEKPTLYTAKDEDPKVMFFKGILPHMSDFTDDENLQFQSGVLQLIQTIRRDRSVRDIISG